MMPDLTPIMIWAATYLIHSTLLLGGVWLWFKRSEPVSHAFREAVWKLAAVGGILTASLQLGLRIESPLNSAVSSIWNSAVQADVQPASLAENHRDVEQPLPTGDRSQSIVLGDSTLTPVESQPHFATWQPADTDLAMEDVSELPLVSASPLVTSTPEPVPNAFTTSASTPFAIGPVSRTVLTGLLAAFCGAIVALSGWGLIRLFTEQWEFRQRLATCRVLNSGSARTILDELLADSGIKRRVRLMLDEHELEPGACGWLNWQIVIPARAAEELSAHELRGLLAHELAHLVRGDQWWLLLGRLLAVCFAWQPLNRIALREWQRASEYLCDAWAIQRRVPRLSLARCLTTVAEWRLVGLATVAGLGSGNASNLSLRVERLVEDQPLADPWQRYSRRHLLAAAGCLIAVGMVGYAPAATLPTPSRPVLATSAQTFEALPSASQQAEHPLVQESITERPQVELIEAPLNRIPADVIVTVETLHVVRQQVSADVHSLSIELEALQRCASQLPGAVDHPLVRLQLQRLRDRLLQVQRLRSAILVPL